MDESIKLMKSSIIDASYSEVDKGCGVDGGGASVE